MLRRIVWAVVLGGALLVASAPAASAHGERAQEAFLKMRTVGWVNVEFSGGTVQTGESGGDEIFISQGEEIQLTGITTILEAWPGTLAGGEPGTGFINVIAPGPVMLVKEKTINGVSAPHRISVEKGGIYEFDITIAGRTVGRWHIHPSFSVKGAGTLLGPGQWVNVQEAEDYTNPVTLLSGETINLENYELGYVWIFSTLTFIIGIGWMLHWTLLHRTVQNLAVTSQIPLNTDGMRYGLISRADHRISNVFLLVTALLVGVYFVYQLVAWPDKLPQQVIEFAPPPIEVPVVAEAVGIEATYDPDTTTVTMSADVTNVGESDIEVSQFTTSTLTFVNPDLAEPTLEQAAMTVEPSGPISPGETATITLTMPDERWDTEKVIPTAESQLEIVGLWVFDPTGYAEVHAPLIPAEF